MIDIHCHLLPCLDDGPVSVEESLLLAQQAVNDGVTHAILTPHIYPGRWNNNSGGIHRALKKFRAALTKTAIPLSVGMAAEVRIGTDLIPLIEKNEIPFIGRHREKNVLLLELPHSHIPPGSIKIIEWMLDNDILPMIAHPERNKDIMRQVEKLKDFSQMGCLFQVTAGSVWGQFGPAAMKTSIALLEAGMVTVLASDAHHPKRRPVNLSSGYSAAIDIVGEMEARKLVHDAPRKIAQYNCALGLVE